MALISIITPAYRAEGFISRAVNSVLRQTHEDWEMIIISDDGQDYKSILFEQGISDTRLRFSTTGQVKSGPSRGRNIALNLAAGDYITTLDADDEYHPEYLAVLVDAAAKHGIAMVFLAYKLKEHGEKVAFISNENSSLGAECVLWSIEDFIKYNGCNVNMFDRKLLKHRYSENIWYGEDFFFDVQFFRYVEQVPVFNEKYYIYHYNPHSLTVAPTSDELFIENYKSILSEIEKIDAFSKAKKYMLLSLYHHRLFQNYLYIAAKEDGKCSDFFDFMKKFPQHFN